MIGDDSTTRVVALRPDEHRERALVAAAGHRRRARSSGGSSSDTKAPSSTRQERVHGDERAGQHRVAVGAASPHHVGGVLDLDGHLRRSASGAVGPRGRHADHAVDAPRRAHRPPDERAGGPDRASSSLVVGGEAMIGARRGRRPRAAGGTVRGRSRARPPRPTAPTGRRRRRGCRPARSRRGVARLDGTVLHLQAAHAHGCSGRRRRDRPRPRCASTTRSDAFGGGVGRRHEHAELPAQLVLPGRRPVRVEHVALVEDGVGDARRATVERRSVTRHSALLAGFLQQLLDGVVPRRQGPRRP